MLYGNHYNYNDRENYIMNKPTAEIDLEMNNYDFYMHNTEDMAEVGWTT